MSWSRFGTISSSLNFWYQAMRPSPQRMTDSSLRTAMSVCTSSKLDASGLQHRSPVSWAVVGRKNKRTQRRHLSSIERVLKLRGCPFLVRAVSFSARDAFAQLLLERSQDLIAPFCVLQVLLITIEPKRGINANEHQNQFGDPTAKARETRTFFSCLTHDLRGKLNQ